MSTVIVGGGIAGLLAAILSKQKNPEDYVVLVEQEESCGGLLRSITADSGSQFDYGTHIPGETGISDLDEILFSGVDDRHWHTMPGLKPGNYFSGELYKYSQLIHVASLPRNELANLTYDFLDTDRSNRGSSDNLEDYLYATYGKTITETVYRPLMEKLLAVPLQEMHKDAHKLFGYERLILGSKEMMQELKQIPIFDELLAFKTYDEGVSDIKNYYPKNGQGVGLWVESLVAQALELGVDLKLSTALTGVEKSGSRVVAVNLDGQRVNCDQLIWTIPMFPLLSLADVDYKPSYKPSIRGLTLHHFEFEEDFLTHNFHVYCNDADMATFRVTLYPNINADGEANGRNRCTVEVLTDQFGDMEALDDRVLQELKDMNIVADTALPSHQFNQIIRTGFPVYTNEFVKELERQSQAVGSALENVLLLGKASAKTFFMHHVLIEVYETLVSKD